MNFDTLIVGAGPAGLSQAIALSQQGFSVALIDQKNLDQLAAPEFDGRDIAMTHQSQRLLSDYGVWARFGEENIHPIREATVQNGESPYALHFERTDDAEAPLGFLVSNQRIRKALFDAAQEEPNITWFTECSVVDTLCQENEREVVLSDGRCLTAPLVIAADSRFSTLRRMVGISAQMKDFGRIMMVSNMAHTFDHRQTAQECFYYGRTCAILPLAEGVSSIVITVPAAQAHTLRQMSDAAFACQAEAFLQGRLGEMRLLSERVEYPLVGAFSDKFAAERFALIGDAAVGMHPVTAHGFNLGLQSVDRLTQEILTTQRLGGDIGSTFTLQRYQIRHRFQARPLYDATNAIVRLYTDDHPVAKVARAAAIRVGNHFLPFKKLVTKRLTASG